MEFDASPVKKKKRRKSNLVRPTKCLIHVVLNADDATLSCFTEQSWKVVEPIKYFEYLVTFH